jgi:pimeloyl-ACP methyl ester carboxylesterase
MEALQTQIQTKTFLFEGETIEYLLAGSGPAVVLLHGAGASARSNWQTTFEQLAAHRRVLALNLPGAGKTTWSKAVVHPEQLSGLVSALAGEEGLARFSLVGYSTGAMVALRAAAQFSQLVDKLVVIAPWLPGEARMEFFFALWGQLLEMDPALFARYNTLTALSPLAHGQMDRAAFEATAQSFTATGFNADLGKLIRMNQSIQVEDALPLIKARTTVIGFAYDNMCPVHNARAVAERVPAAAYTEIAAGHAGPWEASGQVNQAILAALLEA